MIKKPWFRIQPLGHEDRCQSSFVEMYKTNKLRQIAHIDKTAPDGK